MIGSPGQPIPALQNEARIVELDAIRGIAAAMVLITHLPRGFWFGETGVDLFFVLSGFLITGIILRNCRRPDFLRVFYFRRALRIFPIYYLVFFGMVLINSVRRHPGPIDGLAYYLTYFQNVPLYWGGETPPLDLPAGHTWTLAIEEQFYLIWPALLIATGGRRVAPLCGFLVFCSLILRYLGLDRVTLLGHMDGLAMGGLLAAVEIHFGARARIGLNRIYAFLMLAGFAGYAALWRDLSAGGYTGKDMVKSNGGILLVSVAYLGLIGLVQSGATKGRLASILRSRILIQLGIISYGLYLYHWPIYSYLDMIVKFELKQGDPWWLDLMKVAASLTVAVLSWKLIEKPILTLKDRFSYVETDRSAQGLEPQR